MLKGVSQLLHPEGRFCLILPCREEESFVSLAGRFNLFPNRTTRVRGTSLSPVKRSLMEFSFRQAPPLEDLLTLEVQRNQYTEAYTALTRDFYLKM